MEQYNCKKCGVEFTISDNPSIAEQILQKTQLCDDCYAAEEAEED